LSKTGAGNTWVGTVIGGQHSGDHAKDVPAKSAIAATDEQKIRILIGLPLYVLISFI